MTDPISAVMDFLNAITYKRVVHWLLPFKYISIGLCILMALGIIYFSIFTDYLYLKYFVNLDDYYDWKRRKKEKKKQAVKMPEPLMAEEFRRVEDEELFEPEPLISDDNWKKIFDRIDSGKDMDLRLAIIEADKILNRRFDDIGILGRNLRDKMENLPEDIIKKIGRLDSARRVLDELLMKDYMNVSKDTAKKTVEIYQEAYLNLVS
ncbi:MAG: hypothetical protein PHV47_02685 [Candidatus Pacebacteria bacterium]|nr:hypothetical protein [Candidatus Paceibacterota bacterium]